MHNEDFLKKWALINGKPKDIQYIFQMWRFKKTTYSGRNLIKEKKIRKCPMHIYQRGHWKLCPHSIILDERNE